MGAENADEVKALVHWARGRFTEGLSVLDGAAPSDAEQRARLEAVRGMLLHARGDAAAARSAFVRAADLATALGAHHLAATALGSAAAAAHDEGRLGEAWTYATHAVTRFRRLGRPRDAARALMNRAAIACALGARADAMADAARAESLAEAHGDRLTGTYARWIRLECQLLTSESPEAPPGEPALADLGGDDRVLAAAYAVLAGRAPASSLAAVLAPEGDKARWTLARARLAATDVGLDAVRDLARLDDRSAPPSTVGPTLARGLALAAAHHEGDVARAMATRLRALVSRVSAEVPASHRASFEALPWVRATLALDARADAVGLGEGQIDMLTALSRGLRDRTSLGELLRQVVDGMVLWLGVERGLLLLRAPGDQLVARVGRGISRDDLTGEQRKLSMTLARRALETLEPVVAVDAEDESSDVSGSIHALRLRSVLAVPLVARGEALGVVYLDDRVRRGAFGPREVAWVRLLSTQAAAAIADARDTLRLRRLARRAERAKAELEKILARTEGDLAVARQELSRHTPVAAGADPRGTRHVYRAIIGDGTAVRTLLHTLDRVVDAADARLPVLVSGESGTGKELVARAIHELGPRRHRSFVAENCGAIPEPLLESTLFGHVRGAFTGADRPRTGLFEIADGGTLLLDEVGEMGPAMQAKLLRVLQDGEVRPVGGERSVKVDVRVVAATHRDLAAMVAEGASARTSTTASRCCRSGSPRCASAPRICPRSFATSSRGSRGGTCGSPAPRCRRWPPPPGPATSASSRTSCAAPSSCATTCSISSTSLRSCKGSPWRAPVKALPPFGIRSTRSSGGSCARHSAAARTTRRRQPRRWDCRASASRRCSSASRCADVGLAGLAFSPRRTQDSRDALGGGPGRSRVGNRSFAGLRRQHAHGGRERHALRALLPHRRRRGRVGRGQARLLARLGVALHAGPGPQPRRLRQGAAARAEPGAGHEPGRPALVHHGRPEAFEPLRATSRDHAVRGQRHEPVGVAARGLHRCRQAAVAATSRDTTFRDATFKDATFKDATFKDATFKDATFKDRACRAPRARPPSAPS
ncbi:MAG: sigma 54-interacting transcriptional regulator [Myxococcales bacterium]|nr:sigma 54-interacting transcriptional regulator [Myxococcales bacterium]